MTFPQNFLVLGKVDYVTVGALGVMLSCIALSHHWLVELFVSKLCGQR